MDATSLYNLFHETISEYRYDDWLKIKTVTMSPSFRGYYSYVQCIDIDELSQLREPKAAMSTYLNKIYKSILETVYNKLNPVKHVGMKLENAGSIPHTINTIFLTDFNMHKAVSLLHEAGRYSQQQKSIRLLRIDKSAVNGDECPMYALDINDLMLKLNIGMSVTTEDNIHRIRYEWSISIGNPNVTHLSIYQNTDK